MKKITANIHSDVLDYVTDAQRVNTIKQLHNGPVHVVFPHIMQESIAAMKKSIDRHDIEYSIHFAHKPTTSKSLVKTAEASKISIDVASKNELISALSAGFDGTRISCTGPKNHAFLHLAVLHGCVISADSLEEIRTIANVTPTHAPRPRIMLRIANPPSGDRIMHDRTSRFGIAYHEREQAYQLLKERSYTLEGFHFHRDEPDPLVKASYVDGLLSLMQEAREYGFTPTIVNIGGSYRTSRLQSIDDWRVHLDEVEQALRSQTSTFTWRNEAYGMRIKGDHIDGKQKILDRYAPADSLDILDTILSAPSANSERPLDETIGDGMFQLMLEPGHALIHQAGCTFVSIAAVKQTSDNELMIVVDANIFNLSTKMFDLAGDPTLITNKPDNKPCKAYIAGNLCREDDILYRRAVALEHTPSVGDILCIYNTASYSASFEDASPHQHPHGKTFTAYQDNSKTWHTVDDACYYPYLQENQ